VRRLAGAVLRAVLALFLLTVAVTLLLRWVPVPISSMMAQRQLSTLFDKDAPPLHYDWVPLEGISPRMALAVIAAEDQLFADHKGFDMEAIGKALKHNQRGAQGSGRQHHQPAGGQEPVPLARPQLPAQGSGGGPDPDDRRTLAQAPDPGGVPEHRRVR
jgi:hypothetical protein